MIRRTLSIGFICILFVFFGCQTAKKTVEVAPVYQTTHYANVGQPQEAVPGDTLVKMMRGDNFDMLRLNNRITGKWGFVDCALSPQSFVEFEDDGKYLYAFSETDMADGGEWTGHPCGIRYNKTNSLDTGVVFDARKVGGIGNDNIFFFDLTGPIPEIELVPMVNIFAENFLRRTVRFEAFRDGYLTLYVLEEKGQPNGYDATGKQIGTEPKMTERTQSFDLAQSPIVEIMGARIEILDASSAGIEYTVLQPLNEN